MPETEEIETTEQAEQPDGAVETSKAFDAKMEDSETAYPEGKEPEDDGIDIEDDSDEKSADDDKDGDEKSADEKDDDDKPVISDELKRRAERLGLDEDEVKAFKNPETLSKILDSLEPKSHKAEDGEKKDDTRPENPFKFKLNLDKEVYDEGLIGQLESINDHYAGMMGTLFNQVSSLVNQRYTEQFDGAIGGLGDEWHGVFGKGSHGDLDPNSEAFKSRAKLDAAVAMIQKGRESLGKRPLPFKEAFEKALHAEFHGDAMKIKDGKLSKQLQQNKRQVVGRGSRVKGKPLTGREQAIQVSREFDDRLAEEGFDA